MILPIRYRFMLKGCNIWPLQVGYAWFLKNYLFIFHSFIHYLVGWLLDCCFKFNLLLWSNWLNCFQTSRYIIFFLLTHPSQKLQQIPLHIWLGTRILSTTNHSRFYSSTKGMVTKWTVKCSFESYLCPVLCIESIRTCWIPG